MGNAGNVGDACDNAMVEGVFASLECELIDKRSWKSCAKARMDGLHVNRRLALLPRRQHSSIGQKPPINFDNGRQEMTNPTTATRPTSTTTGGLKI